MVINMIVLGLLQIATIYSPNFHAFLAVRSLFGLFMGGVYGVAIAMALENCPVEARGMLYRYKTPTQTLIYRTGLMSGILQQGYSFGYVCAALRQSWCWRLYRILEESILDCCWPVNRCWSHPHCLSRKLAIPRAQGSGPQECDTCCLLARDKEYAWSGMENVSLLHLPDDLVRLRNPIPFL